MPELTTRDFGAVCYREDEVFEFPAGLPGFRECRRFLTLRPEAASPLVVLQSLDQREVAFLTLPATALAEPYHLRVLEEDRRVLGGGEPGRWHVLLLLTLPEQGAATLNLLGPVVLDPASRRGVQAVRDDHRYSAVEPVEAWLGGAAVAAGETECATCS